METIVLVLHVLLALGLIGLVLIQQGKGADAGAAFGSGSSGTVFGPAGSGSFLTRLTTTCATLFFVTSLTLAVMAANRGDTSDSVVDQGPSNAEQEAASGSGDTPEEESVPVEGGGGEGDLPPVEQ